MYYSKNNISIIGTGKLGLCLALNLEKNGYNIVCVDSQEHYIEELKNKTFFSKEPQVNDFLKSSKNIKFTTDTKKALENDIIFIVVQTPSTSDFKYDHRYIEEVCDELIKFGKQNSRKDIIINCTTFPGFCEELHKKMEKYNYFVSYNPEFIAQGSIIKDQIHADMVLIGEADHYAGTLIEKIYESFCLSKKIHKMSRTEAELTKLSLNCFLTTKIAYANMIGDICLSYKCNPDKVLCAIGEDTRVGQKYLKYGFGFGGPCFPRDNRALYKCASEVNIEAFISKATDMCNDSHLEFQIKEYIKNNPDKNKPIEMDYISYKEGSDILIESQQLKYAQHLKKLGYTIKLKENKPELLKFL
jgi:nucleotide sugar dehydrogenase